MILPVVEGIEDINLLNFHFRQSVSLYWLSINLRGIQDICQGTLEIRFISACDTI